MLYEKFIFKEKVLNLQIGGGLLMDVMLTVADAQNKLYEALAEAINFKYIKSSKCLKKTLKDLVFEIDFYSSKWNESGVRIEINAGFRLSYKPYGKLPVDNVIASVMYRPEDGQWYDITTEDKLKHTYVELKERFMTTAVDLYNRFERDYRDAVEFMFYKVFDEYNVQLDFIADNLGDEVISGKADNIYAALCEEMKQQVAEYKCGAKNKVWMLNRRNLKYIIDKGFV